MGLFEIAFANPIQFLDPKGTRFDRLHQIEQINSFQDKRCYFQKWQRDDYTRLQILSDFEDISFNLFDLNTGAPVLNVVPIEMDTNIIGHEFKVYEIPIDFSLVPEGEYYADITYTNELDQLITRRSEPMMVRDLHPETLLFEYENSENNFSIVFETGIVFSIRVEGVIEDFTPSSDDIVYNDQKRNATLLDSIPYRTFTLFVGNAEGVANWMGDKINRVMACDMVQINGDYYEKTEGASWEINRAEEYAFIGMTLEIMPVENRFLQRLKSGQGPGEVTIVQKIQNYADISDSLSASGIFRDKTLLEKIAIIRTGDPFILKVGTTAGGNEIGEFLIEDILTTLNINYLFNTDMTVYLSGISEVSFLSLIYKQLDEKPIPTGLGNPGAGPPSNIPKGGSIVFTFPSQADFDEAFNITSGLGNEGTSSYGWALADGRNGTWDMGGVFPLGFKQGENQPGDIGGEATHTLTIEEMPEHDHDYINTSGNLYSRGGIGSQFFNPNQTEKTGTTGGGQSHNNMPPYKVVVWITRIID